MDRSTKAGAQTPATPASRLRADSLNKGRSANPGDTASPAGDTLACGIAQQRPERKPRRHSVSALPLAMTLAAQQRPERKPRRHLPRSRIPAHPRRTLNKGRSANPGDTRTVLSIFLTPFSSAQQRPERKPRRHAQSVHSMAALAVAQQRPERKPRRHLRMHTERVQTEMIRSTKAGAQTPATPGGHGFPRLPGRSLNKGRSANPGDTSAIWHMVAAV